MAADPLLQALGQNIAFFLIASLYVWIGARRTAGTAAFRDHDHHPLGSKYGWS